jgi:hypothetical protein
MQDLADDDGRNDWVEQPIAGGSRAENAAEERFVLNFRPLSACLACAQGGVDEFFSWLLSAMNRG